MINDYMKKARGANARLQQYPYVPIPPIVCVDGFKISVQASSCHYCSPREDAAYEYYTVECGFPSVAEELIAEYAEDPADLTGTVYAYVPVAIAEQLLELHGGIAE